jgi:hypothetical protein
VSGPAEHAAPWSEPPVRRHHALGVALVLLAALGLHGPEALAANDADDGAYGRLAGDLALSLQVGMSEAFPGESLAGRLGASYLHTAGVYAQYDDSLGLRFEPTARSVGAGVELRPLFLPRFGSDLEQGPAYLDLFIDSLCIALGVYGAASSTDECNGSGLDCWRVGLELGAGVELPLLPQADGPFIALRGSGRWPTTPHGAETTAIDRPGGMVSLGLGYRLVVMTHLVDAGDRR